MREYVYAVSYTHLDVYKRQAKGSFVNKKDTKLIKEENLKKIEDYIKEIMVLAKVCDLDNEELLEMFKLMAEE